MQSVSKENRYLILDGLRGIAALMVLLFHLFEAVAFSAGIAEQKLFHGFLAVDFFFILSGFVMGHSYDPKWSVMTVGDFFRRRLVRLHPMVVIGVATGLLLFLLQGGVDWNNEHMPAGRIILGTLLALFLIPSPLSTDLRGNTEMFPLNGPHWSLFFEYIGSIMYALLLRKLSTRALKVWVFCAALAILAMGLFGPDGSIAYGWSSRPVNMLGGFLRMSFSYPAGLLLSRLFREKSPAPLRGPVFLLCSVALVLLLCMPPLGTIKVWYEVLCIAVAFPALVWLAARGHSGPRSSKVQSALGSVSYPLYAIHYPFIYLYISWIKAGVAPFGPAWMTSVAIALICIAMGVMMTWCYDIPVRKWLGKRTSLCHTMSNER